MKAFRTIIAALLLSITLFGCGKNSTEQQGELTKESIKLKQTDKDLYLSIVAYAHKNNPNNYIKEINNQVSYNKVLKKMIEDFHDNGKLYLYEVLQTFSSKVLMDDIEYTFYNYEGMVNFINDNKVSFYK